MSHSMAFKTDLVVTITIILLAILKIFPRSTDLLFFLLYILYIPLEISIKFCEAFHLGKGILVYLNP